MTASVKYPVWRASSADEKYNSTLMKCTKNSGHKYNLRRTFVKRSQEITVAFSDDREKKSG